MGSCLSRSSFTINNNNTAHIRTDPVLFSMADAEQVLKDSSLGTYLLYKDFESNKIYLSIRVTNRIRHHRITEVNKLFYLEKQPYPYLDSIILYHRRRKLLGVRLKQQAQLSARVIKTFAHRVVAANGNLPHPHPPSLTVTSHLHPSTTTTPRRASRNGSLTSLITSSSDSTTAHARL
ncbi:uncharacterized protein LOC143286321 [Babylonia areolata]|uniref:uncharacterized protein LOC143286321 n=1 Tax=Babylonia areolata TaxID=304850 RepID=UPI003FD0C8F1